MSKVVLKYENVAKVGERIRSYDFRSRQGYIEGVIQRISDENGYRAFVVLVDHDVFRDKSITNHCSRIGHTVYVPMEVAFDDWSDRIEKI